MLAIIAASSFSLPSVRAGSTSLPPNGYITVNHGGWSGTWAVGDYWYRGDGSTRTVSVIKPYIQYQGNKGDNAMIRITLEELKVGLHWSNYCPYPWLCYYDITSVSIDGNNQRWSESIYASSNTDLNTARNNPNSPLWATISINYQLQTSTSQSPPPGPGPATQTVYYEYAVIDSDGSNWGIGYVNQNGGPCFTSAGGLCAGTTTWDFNNWGNNNWWEFNCGFGNIYMNIQETWS